LRLKLLSGDATAAAKRGLKPSTVRPHGRGARVLRMRACMYRLRLASCRRHLGVSQCRTRRGA
jgi:hypothetical protein